MGPERRGRQTYVPLIAPRIGPQLWLHDSSTQKLSLKSRLSKVILFNNFNFRNCDKAPTVTYFHLPPNGTVNIAAFRFDGKDAGQSIGIWNLSILCPRMAGAEAVLLRSMCFKVLNCTAIEMSRLEI